MLSLTTGDFVQPELAYYVNEKTGPVAPKITDTARAPLTRRSTPPRLYGERCGRGRGRPSVGGVERRAGRIEGEGGGQSGGRGAGDIRARATLDGSSRPPTKLRPRQPAPKIRSDERARTSPRQATPSRPSRT
ncbi:MAG: hypothetical protein ACLSVD_04550 [Eggerthellaceae bacterium]